MRRSCRRLGTAALLVALASLMSACVVEEGPDHPHRSSWCYWHPEACR